MGITLQTQKYKNGDLTFILEPNSTVVMTKRQCFYLRPENWVWSLGTRQRLAHIQLLIEQDDIQNLDDLAYWCKGHLAWETTKRKYYEES